MKWQKVQLQQILKLQDPGVWGNEDLTAGVSVLRSTNFRNNGTLDFSKLAFRDIPLKKRTQKKLLSGDILLERSGGSSNQPVGRVVFFEGSSVDHVFGNFITRLRANPNSCNAKYLFWYLHCFHATGRTGQYQKQTTGIRNLEYKRYLTLEVPLPPLSEQRLIVEILDQADRLRQKRAEADAKAEGILAALFIKMFGDPATNPMGWEVSSLDKYVKIGTKLIDPNQDEYLDLLHIGGDDIEKVTGKIVHSKLVRYSSLKSGKFIFFKSSYLVL